MKQHTLSEVLHTLMGMEQLTKEELITVGEVVLAHLADQEIAEEKVRSVIEIYSKYTLIDPNERIDMITVEPLAKGIDSYELQDAVSGLIIWVAFTTDTTLVSMPTEELASAILAKIKDTAEGDLFYTTNSDTKQNVVLLKYDRMCSVLDELLPEDVVSNIKLRYDSAIQTAADMRDSIH